jgi:glycosyltransferase involved in cell wall biosynthesis
MSGPRVVIGAPLYNHADDLPETLESWLIQSYREFRLVCVDDQSTDATGEVVQRYAERDSRIVYTRNPNRLGMIDNWRRAFDLAIEDTPDAEYFAWASDHDIWHPRWLATLMAELDAHPEAVLAYPRNRRIGPDGVMNDKRPWEFATDGLDDLRVRFKRTMRHMSAGNMIYGLGRADAIRRAGVFRHVLVPDRLLLMELALEGQFRQVPDILWFRRWYGRIFSLQRQRRAFFPNGRPFYAFVPWWISHAVALTWILGCVASGRPTSVAGPGLGSGGAISGWPGCCTFGRSSSSFDSTCSSAPHFSGRSISGCGGTIAGSCGGPALTSSRQDGTNRSATVGGDADSCSAPHARHERRPAKR